MVNIHWTERKNQEVWHEGGRINSLICDGTTTQDIESKKTDRIRQSIKLMLENEGRNSDSTEIEDIINAEGEAITYDFFVPDVMFSRIRHFVSVEKRAILRESNKDERFPLLINSHYENAKQLENFKVELSSETYAENLENLAKKLESYQSELVSFSGDINVLNFDEEARKILNFRDSLKTLAVDNGIDLSEENYLITIGITEKYKVCYVTLTPENVDSEKNAIDLFRTFARFKKLNWVDSKRTINYLIQREKIQEYKFEESESKPELIDFISKFTDPPPVIKPKHLSGDSIRNLSKTPELYKAVGKYKLEESLNDFQKPVYSANEKLQNLNSDIANSTLLNLQSLNDNSLISVDSGFVQDASVMVDNLNSLSAMYDKFFNKFDIQPTLNELIACLEERLYIKKIEEIKARTEAEIEAVVEDVATIVDFVTKPPKPPTFPRFKRLFTVDPQANFKKGLIKGLELAALLAGLAMIKMMLQVAVNICENKKAIPDPDNPFNPFDEEALVELGNRFGAGILKDLQDVLPDISAVLSPYELCSLLEKQASDDVLDLVETLIRTGNYSELQKLELREEIENLFSEIGRTLGVNFCEDLLSGDSDVSLDGLCDNSSAEEFEKIRTKLLQLRDPCMTPEQLGRQKELIQEALAVHYEELLKLSKDPSSIFDRINPCDSELGGIEPTDSMKFAAEKTVNVLFEATNMSFNEDIESIRSSFFVEKIQEGGRGTTNEVLPEVKSALQKFEKQIEKAEFSDLEYVRSLQYDYPISDALAELDRVNEKIKGINIEEDPETAQQLQEFQQFTADINIQEELDDLKRKEKQSINLIFPKSLEQGGIDIVYDSTLPSNIKYATLAGKESSFAEDYFVDFIINLHKTTFGKNIDFSEIKPLYREAYLQIVKKILQDQSNSIRNSELIQGENINKLRLVPSYNQNERTARCQVSKRPEIDLLGIDNAKEIILGSLKNLMCPGRPVIVNEKGERISQNDLEEKSIDAVVTTLLRVYLVEFFMKSIFVWESIDFTNPLKEKDTKLLKILAKSIARDLRVNYSIDADYYAAIYEKLVDLHNRLVESGFLESSLINEKDEDEYRVFVPLLTKEWQDVKSDFIKIAQKAGFTDGTESDMRVTQAEEYFASHVNVIDFIDGEPRYLQSNRAKINEEVVKPSDSNLVIEQRVYVEFEAEREKKLYSFSEFDLFLAQNRYTNPDIKRVSFFVKLLIIPSGKHMFSKEGTGWINSVDPLLLKENKLNGSFVVDELRADKGIVQFLNVPVLEIEEKVEFENVFDLWSKVSDVLKDRNNKGRELRSKLFKQPVFNLWFLECFPISVFNSYLSLICSDLVDIYQGTDNSLSATKTQLKRAFNSLKSVGNPNYSDSDIEALGGNVGLAEFAKGESGSFAKIFAKIIKEAPIHILKAIVKLTDLNINLSMKIQEKLKAKGINKSLSFIATKLNFAIPLTPFGWIYLGLHKDDKKEEEDPFISEECAELAEEEIE
jgi:hypothetical protein